MVTTCNWFSGLFLHLMAVITRLFYIVFLGLPFLGFGQSTTFYKYKYGGNLDSAIVFLETKIHQAHKLKDTAQVIDYSAELAKKLTDKSRYTKAKRILEECLDYPYVQKRRELNCELLIRMGNVCKYESEYVTALKFYHQAKTLAEKSKKWVKLIKCEVELAEYFRKLNDSTQMFYYLNSAFQQKKIHQLKDTSVLIYLYNRAAAIHNEYDRDLTHSIAFSKLALRYASTLGDRYSEAVTYNELGYTYQNLLKFDSSEVLYKKAVEIWRSIGADRDAMHAMKNLGMLYLRSTKEEKAMAIFREIIAIVKKERIAYPLNDEYGELCQYYIRNGDSLAAFRSFYLYHGSVIDDIRNKHNGEIVNLSEKFENERARAEVKIMKVRLNESQQELEQKKVDNQRMFLFLSVLTVLILIIAVLFFRNRAANKKLSERNKEKDVLIQEIHHRVKNNLQFISSLLNMQRNSSQDEVEKHTLNDASRRIRAMALVHEMLYNHNDSNGISIKKYLEELILSLDQLVNSNKIPIAFKLDLEEHNFSVTESIALGMITSELVSNSMKYAFAGIENPCIEVKLSRTQNQIAFSLKDNGVGVKDEKLIRKNLGTRLIDIFSRQLKGTYSIETNGGYWYKLQFTVK